jgi:acetate---CoA ligase (ADP-forming)
MTDLDRLFNPRTVVVVGGKEAQRVMEQCDRFGFEGSIWPVNPTRAEMRGRLCYPSIESLPGVPDAAYVAVNRERSVDIIARLAAIGCGGAISYAAGFAEIEHSAGSSNAKGGALQQQLVAAAGSMPLLGPNCYGFINTLSRVTLWPDQHGARPCARGVAIVTQSSNIAISMTMQTSGLPIAYVATAGNQAQLGLSTIASALLEDDRVSALGLHIEGLDDTRLFEQFARRARELGKPVVVLRVGTTEQARATALTHTASLAGSSRAFSTLLHRLGIASVTHLDTFLQTLLLLHTVGPLMGSAVLSLSCSGGEAALMADALGAQQLMAPAFPVEQEAALREILGDLTHISNPLDYNTFIWGQWQHMARMFAAATDGPFDLALLVLDFPRQDRCDTHDWEQALDAYIAGVQASGMKAAVVATLPENLPEAVACRLVAHGLAPLRGLASALGAVRAAADIGEAWRRSPSTALLHVPQCVAAEPRIYDEFEAKQALRECGLRVPRGWRLSSATDVDELLAKHGARETTYALKALGLAHKSERGGVRLGLRDADAIREALQGMAALSSSFLLEEMAPDDNSVELLVGITRDDAAGLMLTLGAGGVLAEVIGDTRSLLLPVTEEEVRGALGQLSVARLLRGYRGAKPVDVVALIANIMAIASFAQAHHTSLRELDVNPLIAGPRGCMAVDALLIQDTIDE